MGFAHAPALRSAARCFDDAVYVTENELVRSPSAAAASRFLREVRHPSTVEGYYQPFTMISLMLDVARGAAPQDLRPFHETNLALHIVNTLLVAGLVDLLSGSAWGAFAAALLFGLHPVTVEPIAWVSERKTLLAACFALGSLVSYVAWARRPRRWLYAASLVAFGAALLSKPTATPLPAAMLLLRFWPLRDLSRARVREIIPHLALALVSAVVTYVSQRESASVATPWGLAGAPLLLATGLGFYLRILCWPVGLAPFHPFPDPLSAGNPEVLGGIIASLLLAAGAAFSLLRTRAVATCLGFGVVILLPALQVVQFSDSMGSDKYVYLPMVGLAVGLGALVARQGRGKATILTLLLALSLGAAALSFRQYSHWRTTEELERYMLERQPRSATLHYDLGNALWDSGRMEEAAAEYREAARLAPRHVLALTNLAGALAATGREDEAVRLWHRVLALDPESYTALHNLGYHEYERAGKTREALARYEEALRLYRLRHPGRVDDSVILSSIGHALLELGELDAAIARLDAAVSQPVAHPPAYLWLGLALGRRAAIDPGVLARFERLFAQGQPAPAYAELEAALARAGRTRDAARAGALAGQLREMTLPAPPP